MKILKNTLTILLIAFISMNVNAQEKYKDYHKNGKLKSEGQYDSNDKVTGVWKVYYKTGGLKTRYEYANGNRHGSAIEYYENGKTKHIGQFLNNKATGIWKLFIEDDIFPEFHYVENGVKKKLTKNICLSGGCKNGYGIKYTGGWMPKIYEGNFINGKPNGKGEQLNILNGSSKSFTKEYKGNFKNGKYHGNGKLLTYETDKTVTTFNGEFENGNRKK